MVSCLDGTMALQLVDRVKSINVFIKKEERDLTSSHHIVAPWLCASKLKLQRGMGEETFQDPNSREMFKYKGYVRVVCALRSYFWGNHWGSGRGEECFTSGVLSGILKVVKRSDCLFKVILQTQWSCLVDAAVHPNQVWLHHGWEQGWSFQHHHGHGDWVRAGCLLGGDGAQALAAPVCATLGQFLKWKFKTDILCFC